ncbi:MAG: ABC transporter permease, partial [Mesorhizobium sp.]
MSSSLAERAAARGRSITLRDYAIRYGFIILLVGLIAYFAIA